MEGDKFEDKMYKLRIDDDEHGFNWFDFLRQQFEFIKVFVNNRLIIESNQ